MMSGEQQSLFGLVESPEGSRPDWFGLSIDYRRLFDALQDGWLRPPPADSGSLVGVDGYLCDVEEPNGKRIPVQIRIDIARLPDIEVLTLRDNHWQSMSLSNVVATDAAVFWPGPLPLFSTINLCVSSEEQRVRLLSIGKRTANVEVPAVRVSANAQDIPKPAKSSLVAGSGLIVPARHDALRGAISMAIWAVPRIDPWLELLTASLSAWSQKLSDVAESVDASWWRLPPWMRAKDATPSSVEERLWLAASEVFTSPDRKGMRDSVEKISALARQGESVDDTRMIEEWRSTTHRVLTAEGAIRLEAWREHPVGLAIQLVLTRPKPTAFRTWFDDNRITLPPAVAWSAATLCGLLQGYRNLDTRFRGKEVQREVVAVQSLRMCSDGASISWPRVNNDPPKWQRKTGNFLLSWGGIEFACKQEQERGKWYAANLENDDVQSEALGIAKENGWPCRKRIISFGEGVRPVLGSGLIESRERAVQTLGDIQVQLLPVDQVEEVLDADKFRRFISVEPGCFAAPPASEDGAKSLEHSTSIPGLTVIPDFITEAEEKAILGEIDHSDWNNELQRRVQHYGWRYDYKSRQIDPSMHLGPLPAWAYKIAQRLVDVGYFRDGFPDQVIVNEYCGNQGITPHIDSPASFTGVVAMVSLLESWEMEFQRGREKNKVCQKLEQRSATILEGEARYKWKHGIPKRKTEPGTVKPGNKKPSRIQRDRRVSLTFRKVTDAAQLSDGGAETVQDSRRSKSG